MPTDVLRRAAELIRRGHSTGWPLARSATGRPCHPNDSIAALWSLHGALMRAAHDLDLGHVLQTARAHASGHLWRRHRMQLVWAELDPRFDASRALECLLHSA